jgi:hypothetical protein
MMKTTLFSAVCALAMVSAADAAHNTNLVFHVQLVRGSDQATPPTKESKPIGRKLAAQFRPIFAWKHFWEVKYAEVPLALGQKTRVRLNAQREVEIDLGTPGKRAVTTHSDGKALSRSVEHVDAPMTIIGGDRDAKSAWFIVVRRDKPSID